MDSSLERPENKTEKQVKTQKTSAHKTRNTTGDINIPQHFLGIISLACCKNPQKKPNQKTNRILFPQTPS
jgi:hypothetical protein